jgi:hypothetical protein
MIEQVKYSGLKILHLNLSKLPFDVMITGEKKEEYRKPSKWIKSRMYQKDGITLKDYDLIHIVNGYGDDRPYFICRYLGHYIYGVDNMFDEGTRNYSNGLEVILKRGDFIIGCGEILEVGNV